MKNRLETFLELSAFLTGFDRDRLFGTAMAEEYLRLLEAIVPTPVLDALLNAAGGPAGEDGSGLADCEQILGDPRLGPVARNLILLWYCGTWTQLPEQWRAANGSSPLDTTRVVSAGAYLAGLQWALVGAHPAGGMSQGFAAWSAPPEEDAR